MTRGIFPPGPLLVYWVFKFSFFLSITLYFYMDYVMWNGIRFYECICICDRDLTGFYELRYCTSSGTKAWFPLVLRIVRIGDFYDLPTSGILTTSVNTPSQIPNGRQFLRRDRKNRKHFYFQGTVPDGPRRRRFLR